MKIVEFEGCNVNLPQMANSPAMMMKEGNLICYLIAWEPNEQDKKNIKAGKPIILQVYKEVVPTLIYTVNENGKPNI